MNNYLTNKIKLFLGGNHEDISHEKFTHGECFKSSQKIYSLLIQKISNQNHKTYPTNCFVADTFLNLLEIIKIVFLHNFPKGKLDNYLYLLSFYSAKNILYFSKVRA